MFSFLFKTIWIFKIKCFKFAPYFKTKIFTKNNLALFNMPILQFLRLHWFKIVLTSLTLWVYFQKDLNFRFQLDSSQKQLPPVESTKYSKRSNAVSVAKADAPSSNFSLFDFFKGKKKNYKTNFEAVGEKATLAYIKRFGKVARTEQKRFGIPASITLANALLQSSVGTSDLASATDNNHFNLLCSDDWQGATAAQDGQCFRRYATAWESFRDHSLYLTQHLEAFKYKKYPTWSKALGEALGDEQYTLALNEVIEHYQLYLLDGK